MGYKQNVTFRKEGVDWNIDCDWIKVICLSHLPQGRCGLKFPSMYHSASTIHVTFRREGVDWNRQNNVYRVIGHVIFRKEGVDWNDEKEYAKYHQVVTFRKEGVDWNNQINRYQRESFVTFRKEGADWNIPPCTILRLPYKSLSARKVTWLKLESKVNEYFEYCVTFCKWRQFHRFDKEAPPPLGAILQCRLRLFQSFFLYFVTKIRWTINRFLLCCLCW